MPSQEKQHINDVMAEMYQTLDGYAEIQAAKMKTTCKKGCSSCCYLFAIIGPANGLVLADHILKQPNWESWLPKLAAAAEKTCFEGVCRTTYFDKAIPCVFLDTESGTCKVYDKRPAACRFHYVVSDPKDCSPHAPGRPTTASIDFIQLEELTWAVDLQLTKQMGWEMPPAGPIPVVVLHMMQYLTKDDLYAHGEVMKYSIGIPDSFQWLKKYGDGLVAEGSGVVGKISPEELQKLQER